MGHVVVHVVVHAGAHGPETSAFDLVAFAFGLGASELEPGVEDWQQDYALKLSATGKQKKIRSI